MSDEIRRLLAGVRALELETGLRLAVIGGIARGAWAAERNTFDVDVVADREDLTPLHRAAAAAGLIAVPNDVDKMAKSGMTRLRLPEHLTGRIRLDIVGATHPYYVRVVDRSVHATIHGIDVKVATAEDIVLLKVLADRPQDRADVAAIVEAQGDALDRALLRREAASLEVDLPVGLA